VLTFENSDTHHDDHDDHDDLDACWRVFVVIFVNLAIVVCRRSASPFASTH